MWKRNYLGRWTKVSQKTFRTKVLICFFRVPAIAHWPNQIAPGKEDGLMSTLDVLPTVMGGFGIQSAIMDTVLIDGQPFTSLINFLSIQNIIQV